MKIALLGYGKMSQLVEKLALEQGHVIVSRFSPTLGLLENRKNELAEAEMAIDFSQASATLQHVEICLSMQKPLVIGTTGWEDQLPYLQQKVKEMKGSCLYAPNFSLGVYLFKKIMSYAASLFQPFDHYDISGIESHHRHKLDQPSGTAKSLSHEILKQMPRLKSLDFTSVRCGAIPGTHTLQFDSEADSLIFTHQARSRQGFAEGAILAAHWLLNRPGFFTLDDMIHETFERK